MKWKNYVKIARPDHWIKNLFLLPGSFFAVLLTSCRFGTDSALRLLTALACACLTASANYVLNEWLDAGFDRYHPTKRNRPMVTETMCVKWILLEYLLLAAAGLSLSVAVGVPFFITAVLLLVMGLLYNVKPVRTKDLPYLDVITESFNNALRFLLGWFAITGRYYPPVSIVLGFWLGGAFLMAMKRFSEYRMIADRETAGRYRRSFLHYSEKSLLISSFFYAMCSVFLIGVFMVKYRMELLLAVPFLCGLFCLYFYIAFKKDSAAQKPEKLFREKPLMIYAFFFIVLVAVLMVVKIPGLSALLNTGLIPTA